MTKRIFDPRLRNPEHFQPKLPLSNKIKSAVISVLGIQPPYIRLIDSSRYNTITDYQKLKSSGIVGNIIKATQGTWHTDPKFERTYNDTVEADLVPMIYMFFESDEDGGNQADKCLSYVMPFIDASGVRPIIWVDLEDYWNSVAVTTRRTRFFNCLDYVKNNYKKGGAYCSRHYWQLLLNNPALGDHYGWGAHWTSSSVPLMPINWTETQTIVWQYGIYPTYPWVEPVYGISGNIDVNRYGGTLEQLKELNGYEKSECPPVIVGKVWTITTSIYSAPEPNSIVVTTKPLKEVIQIFEIHEGFGRIHPINEEWIELYHLSRL